MAKLENKILLIEKRLDDLEETMEIMADKKTVRSIERGLKDLREGRIHRYESVEAFFEEFNKKKHSA